MCDYKKTHTRLDVLPYWIAMSLYNVNPLNVNQHKHLVFKLSYFFMEQYTIEVYRIIEPYVAQMFNW